MANSSLGYSEPASPNKRLFSRSLSEDAQTKDVQGVLVCDASGNVVGVTGNALDVNTEFPAAAALADGTANPTVPGVGAYGLVYNPATATWERARTNTRGLILASQARTTTISSNDQVSVNHRGAHVYLNVSAGSGFSIVPKVEGKDTLSGIYYALHAAATAVTATGLYVYSIYPGESAAAAGGVTMRVSAVLPTVYRVTVTHGDATSVTYSVYHSLMV